MGRLYDNRLQWRYGRSPCGGKNIEGFEAMFFETSDLSTVIRQFVMHRNRDHNLTLLEND